MAAALQALPTPLPRFCSRFPQGPAAEPNGPLGAGEIGGQGPDGLDRLPTWDPHGLRPGAVPSKAGPGDSLAVRGLNRGGLLAI